jgi:rhodanese-related sulfurtransferase
MVLQLSVAEYKKWLDQKQSGYTLLDVREPWEVQTCALEDSINIPMGQVPSRLEELDREQPIVVVCHHGVRSQRVAMFLEHSGFKTVYNLRGGVDAWAKEIDPGFPSY